MNRKQRLLNARPLISIAAGKACLLIVGALLSGCAALPEARLQFSDPDPEVMRAVMARQNRIVQLSSPPANVPRPALLLLHGATEDPTEMMEIVRQWNGKYAVYLYSYNYHERAEKLAADLVREMERLRTGGRMGDDLTVVTFSYSAIVFRKAVIQADSPAAFSGATLIQLVPTAGGSRLALGMGIPIIGSLASLASKPSAAQNPFGRFARALWEGEGNRKFYEVIPPQRMHTLLVEGDSHSLAAFRNANLQRRYRNGIGQNVVIVPKSTGVTHDYFPTHPVALAYLRRILERPAAATEVAARRETGRNRPREREPIEGGKVPGVAARDLAGNKTAEAVR